MNTKRVFPPLVVMIAIVVLLLSACSASGVPESPEEQMIVEEEVRQEGEMDTAPSPLPTAGSGQEASEEGSVYDAPGSAGQLAVAPPSNRMVIKDAEMELLVEDTDLAVSQVTQLAADSGGYIISSQTFYKNGYLFATMRLGVPVATFESTLNTLRNFGLQVINETASGKDVSAEYVDLESRLANLEATAARVRSFLDNAQSVEESLRVSQQLSELERQIEQIKGQMRFYEGRAAFSTVTVQIVPRQPTPTPAATPTPAPEWDPGDTFEDASDLLVRIVQFIVDRAIWMGVVFGPFVLVGLVGLWSFRKMRRQGRSQE